MLRASLLVIAVITSGVGLQGQDKDPVMEIGAAYSRAATEKETIYMKSIEDLSKKFSRMQVLTQENKEDSIVAMKSILALLQDEGKSVLSSYEQYKANSKAYLAALDRMPSALRPLIEAAKIKAQKNSDNPVGKQYEGLVNDFNKIIDNLPLRRKDVEKADKDLAQAIKETESAVEFLSDYSVFLDVLALGDITGARQAFREKMHQFMRNYQKFDGLMRQFHDKLRATSSSDEIRKEYEAEKANMAKEAAEQERERIHAMEQEKQSLQGQVVDNVKPFAPSYVSAQKPSPKVVVSQSSYRPVNYANVAKASANVQRNINSIRRFIK
jgi:hypothetical protein